MKVSERRKLQLEQFNERYIHDMEKARFILNSYYRYVGLSNRLLILENDERTFNTRYCQELARQEESRRNKLKGYLEPYGISIFVPWCTPCLGIVDKSNGAISENVIDPILY